MVGNGEGGEWQGRLEEWWGDVGVSWGGGDDRGGEHGRG